MTTLAAIRAAVATRLALIAGSAPYTTSVGRRIAYGLDAAPHAQAPCLRYQLGATRAERGGQLGGWRRTVEVVVEAFIGGGASGGLEDVEDAASAVHADILTALAGGPTLGGIVWDLDAVDADPAMAPAEASDGMAVVRVTATYSWEERI